MNIVITNDSATCVVGKLVPMPALMTIAAQLKGGIAISGQVRASGPYVVSFHFQMHSTWPDIFVDLRKSRPLVLN